MSAATPAVQRPFPRTTVCVVAGLAVATALAVWRVRPDVASLLTVKTFTAFGDTFGRLWPPRTDAETLGNLRTGLVETAAMSVVGTFLGALIGLVLMPFCAETVSVRGALVDEEDRPRSRHALALAVHNAARLLANVLRTVPYFVWAMLFWFMVGPGAFAGALAIAVHTGGVIARNYAQAIDQVDPRPAAALRSCGARRFHVFLFGILPAARSALAALTLYRWEVNIRESTVLGLVGTVGLGFHMKYAIGIFDWRAASAHLAAIVALVLLVDGLSAFVRKRLL